MSEPKGAAAAQDLYIQKNEADKVVCRVAQEGNIVTITVDLDQEALSISSTGKSVLLATCSALTTCDKHGEVRVGVNISHRLKGTRDVLKYKERILASAEANGEATTKEEQEEAQSILAQASAMRQAASG